MRLTPNLETTTMGCEVGWDSISPEPVEVTGGERATLAEPLYSHVDRSIEFTQYSRNAWDVPRDGEWVHALPKLLRSHWPTSRPRLSGLPHPRLERSPSCPLHPRMLNGRTASMSAARELALPDNRTRASSLSRRKRRIADQSLFVPGAPRWQRIMRSNNGRRLERNRKFVDSPLEGDGFEPSVRPSPVGSIGAARRSCLRRSGSGSARLLVLS